MNCSFLLLFLLSQINFFGPTFQLGGNEPINKDDTLSNLSKSIDNGTMKLPKDGKDFVVKIRVLAKYVNELANLESPQYQALQKKIQEGILDVYADDDNYQDTVVLGFKPDENDTSAELLVRFNKPGIDYLIPLAKRLMTNNLGSGLPVSAYFTKAENANYDDLVDKLCTINCRSKTTCVADKCHPSCCSILVPLTEVKAPNINLPRQTFKLPHNRESLVFDMPAGIASNQILSVGDPIYDSTYGTMLDKSMKYFGPRAYSPSTLDTLLPPKQLQAYQQQMDSQLFDSRSLCDGDCSSLCYPHCSDACCSTMKRSFVQTKFYKHY